MTKIDLITIIFKHMKDEPIEYETFISIFWFSFIERIFMKFLTH